MEAFYLWQSFKFAEKTVANYLTYVPWDDIHLSVWSDRLASILIDIGSKVDSSFRNTLDGNFPDDFPNIVEVRSKERKDVNINDFAKTYNEFYQLNQKEVRILSSPVLSLIKPWENWSESSSPMWWRSYNKVKHDRFKNAMEATIKDVVNALGALFLNCIIIQDYQSHLIDIDIIKSNYAKGWMKSVMSKKIEPNFDLYPIIARSDVLGYVYEPRGKEDWSLLEPGNAWNL